MSNMYPYSQPNYQNPYMFNQPVPEVPQYRSSMNYTPIVYDQVQGKVAASIYPLLTNQEARLFDVDQPYLYIKKNLNGKIQPLQSFKLVEETESTKEQGSVADMDLSEYVKMDEFLDIVSDTVKTEVDKRLSEISFKPSKEVKKGDD